MVNQNSIEWLSEYRNKMDGPMEDLTLSLNNDTISSLDDAQIIELAAKKIRTLRSVLESVLNKGLVDAIMKE